MVSILYIYKFILKQVQLLFLERGEKSTFRGCQLDGGKSNVCDIIRSRASSGKNQITIEECSVCIEDGCNKSANLKLSGIIIFFSLIFVQAIR